MVASENSTESRIPLNDNIIWCKYSRVNKELSKREKKFLLNATKFLGARLILSTCKTHFLKCIPLRRNPSNLKGFFVKIEVLSEFFTVISLKANSQVRDSF